MLLVIGAVLALAVGIYIGLGWPGLNVGRHDRVLRGGRRQPVRRAYTPLDWFKPRKTRLQ
jgi:hypothetical protein